MWRISHSLIGICFLVGCSASGSFLVNYSQPMGDVFPNYKYELGFINHSYLLINQILPDYIVKFYERAYHSEYYVSQEKSNFLVLKFDEEHCFMCINDRMDEYLIITEIDSVDVESVHQLSNENTSLFRVFGFGAIFELSDINGTLIFNSLHDGMAAGRTVINFEDVCFLNYPDSCKSNGGSIVGTFEVPIE